MHRSFPDSQCQRRRDYLLGLLFSGWHLLQSFSDGKGGGGVSAYSKLSNVAEHHKSLKSVSESGV